MIEETISKSPSQTEVRTPQGDLLSVDANGAKITLSLNDILILTSVIRGDKRTGITHPCSPIFGPDENDLFGLSQHGNMRNEACSVTRNDNQVIVDHDITDKGYPQGVSAHQALKVENGIFSLSFNHKNNGTEEAPVNSAMHFYFDAPEGYQDATINGDDIAKIMKDAVNGVVIDLKEENIIKIPGKPELILTQKGFNKVALWVGRDDRNIRDKNYLCIEPIEFDPEEFGKGATLIYPGNERTAELTLKIKK